MPLKLDSASSLWMEAVHYCEPSVNEIVHGAIGPYEYTFECVERWPKERRIGPSFCMFELHFPMLGVKIRKRGPNAFFYKAKWAPRRPSDETLALIALARPTKRPWEA